MTTPTPGTAPVRMRATHADRDDVAALVDGSIADGSLDPEEGARRIEAVRAAVYRDEFAVLLADLPNAQPPAAEAPRARGRAGSFVASHRTLAWILAAVVVLLVVAGGVLAATDGFGGGHQEHTRVEPHDRHS